MKTRRAGTTSRRDFFSTLARYATLGVLGAGAGAAAVKRRKLLGSETCINSGICRGCSVFDDCHLPQAISAKAVLSGEDHGK